MPIQELKQPNNWIVPTLWEGQTVVCVGGGPSLTLDQLDYVKGKAGVIAINNAYELAPWADILYAGDRQWWDWHEGCPEFTGIKVCIDEGACKKYGLFYIGSDSKVGLSTDQTFINTGRNSGFAAVNIAYLAGAARIVLIGYDMKFHRDGRSHWFGDHPNLVRSNYNNFISQFDKVADQNLVDIVNCTPKSALKCFRIAELEDVF